MGGNYPNGICHCTTPTSATTSGGLEDEGKVVDDVVVTNAPPAFGLVQGEVVVARLDGPDALGTEGSSRPSAFAHFCRGDVESGCLSLPGISPFARGLEQDIDALQAA
jgi:hypothetical protein